MKIKISIQNRMLLSIIFVTVLIFSLAIGYNTFQLRKTAFKGAKEKIVQANAENAIRIEKELSEGLTVLKTLSETFTTFNSLPEEERKNQIKEVYFKVFPKNPEFYKLWDSWELNMFDPEWNKEFGRSVMGLKNEYGQVIKYDSVLSLDGDPERYAEAKRIQQNMIWEPYWEVSAREQDEKRLITSISAPVFKNGHFAGLIAADVVLGKFQEKVEKMKPYPGCTTFLVSNKGMIISHSNKANIGKQINSVVSGLDTRFGLSGMIANGQAFITECKSHSGCDVILSIYPIQVGEYKAPWSLGIIVPVDIISKEANRTLIVSLIIFIIGLVILSMLIYFILRNQNRMLSVITGILQKLSKGEIKNTQKLHIETGDEIEKISTSVNILIDGLNRTSEFANQIGNGNLKADFEPLGENDSLGNSLIEMRKSLEQTETETIKRKTEDEKVNWSTQGLARFSEILRANSQNINELAYDILKNLVNYIDVNQGTLFVVDDTSESELVFEIKAAIAYERRKFLKKKVAIGEELVGQCAYERKTIYLTDIPEDYIQITSGLGDGNPTALLLVPLVLNDEIFGVVELASFSFIEDYKIKFVEKLAESIASTISTVKINERTTYLLNQSKQQAEELAAQEEEMRQNLEELQATQEEAARRESELSSVVKALGAMAFIVEYDMEGNIINLNDTYARMLGMEAEQLIGQNHRDGFDFSVETTEKYNMFWSDLRKGISKKEVNKLIFNNREKWVEEIYTPIFALHETKPYKILKIGFDITNQKKKEEELRHQEQKLRDEDGVLAKYKEQISALEIQIDKLKTETKPIIVEKPEPIAPTAIKEEPIVPSFDRKPRSELVEWETSYEVGITELDEQHKKLIDLANQAYIAFRGDKSKKEIKEIIRSLVDFAAYHCGTEENYFNQFDYPDIKTHQTEHKKFIDELTRFQSDFMNNKLKSMDSLIDAMRLWLRNHVGKVDRQYIPLFKEKGMR